MSLKEKQDYLFLHIIEQKYDPEEFQDFMEKYKGLNLQVYSLHQLENVVNAFKNGQKESSQDQNQENQLEAKNIVKTGQLVEVEHQKKIQMIEKEEFEVERQEKLLASQQQIKSSTNSAINTNVKHIKKTVFPQLFKKVHQFKENISIKIRSYTKTQSEYFLFKTTFIAYHIETSNGWKVKRRFNQFRWLHSKLQEMYPGIPVPPIPKKTKMRNFDDKHLEERMICFEMFFNKILTIPELCSDSVIQEFLSIQGAHEFQLAKERYEAKLATRNSMVYSLKGELLCIEKGSIERTEITKIERSLELMKILNNQISSLEYALKGASEIALAVSSTFHEIQEHSKSQQINRSELFSILGDFMSDIGYIQWYERYKIDNQYFHIKHYIQNQWSYEEKYLQTVLNEMNSINKQHYNIHHKYKDIIGKVGNHQEDDFNNQSLNDYFRNKEAYKIQLSFLMQSLNQLKDDNLCRFAKDWEKAMSLYISEVKNCMLSGADQLTRAICVVEGKKLIEVEYLANINKKKSQSMISQEY